MEKNWETQLLLSYMLHVTCYMLHVKLHVLLDQFPLSKIPVIPSPYSETAEEEDLTECAWYILGSILEYFITSFIHLAIEDMLTALWGKPHKAVSISSIARWIKEVMKYSNIDPKIYQAHSVKIFFLFRRFTVGTRDHWNFTKGKLV